VISVLTRTSTILLEGLKDLSNGAAWQEFEARYRPLLLAVGRRLGLTEADAEDAAQETVAAFLRDNREGRYSRERGRLRDWLAGIMSHKVRDLQRRQVREDKLLREQPAASDGAEDERIHAVMEEEWGKATLRMCLEEVRKEVAPQMYESFELSALRLWPAGQVAKRLGISVDAVYQNKSRVLQAIRELLPKMEEIW
jgi:RNA polymerase sigma-70 factor, ECF subfamily